LQLRYGRRLGYTDIAAALGQTPKGAERLLARAVSALRREMAAN
jgi:DNA-directed RNA polymerase specialized sigma24 family protein